MPRSATVSDRVLPAPEPHELVRRTEEGDEPDAVTPVMKLGVVGRRNAGKSTFINALAGEERMIVSEIPGTTRDVLREQIDLDGIPVHVADTAGIRDTDCVIEAEGVRRARAKRWKTRTSCCWWRMPAGRKKSILNCEPSYRATPRQSPC